MAMLQFKISKLLTNSDITTKLVLPTQILVHIPFMNRKHIFLDLLVMDSKEQVWTNNIICIMLGSCTEYEAGLKLSRLWFLLLRTLKLLFWGILLQGHGLKGTSVGTLVLPSAQWKPSNSCLHSGFSHDSDKLTYGVGVKNDSGGGILQVGACVLSTPCLLGPTLWDKVSADYDKFFTVSPQLLLIDLQLQFEGKPGAAISGLRMLRLMDCGPQDENEATKAAVVLKVLVLYIIAVVLKGAHMRGKI
ncbi:hypothetical protein EZV62_006379 [Acer yangbiense]|uniref:Uncharacterized protein n=1 Tax=Acer yangbiense TaxID=1000413 RepID=A0A5C7I7H0_9ROSI|nr:hypothetical protein EZV62_006379 [Acer yangbiense]